LLRALALGEVRPVGATQATTVDVNVVAATNRDLDADAAAGRFRADLLARLAGWRIAVPPLRARREDILALAQLFLARPGPALPLSPAAAEALVLHGWPWNARELQQVVAGGAARAAAAGAGVLGLEHLPPNLHGAVGRRVAPPREAEPDDAPNL